MSDHFDRSETRTQKTRETALMRDLRAALKIARARAPALHRQLNDLNIDDLRVIADLARIPLLRKSALKDMQKKKPPFGGVAATNVRNMKRIFVSPGPIFELEGYAKDFWGAARALYAAGMRKGDIALNTFAYHFTPGAHIFESGAHALGCAVIPAGPGSTELQLAAIAQIQPNFYCGTPDFLKILLDKVAAEGVDARCLKKALVSGAALPQSLRKELRERAVEARQAYATADVGVIAYETTPDDGLVVNEGLIVEIVRPGTSEPVAFGEVGEVVVTRITMEYPLLRLATGDLSAFTPGVSACGRTNRRLRGWLGRADQTTKIKGMFVHPEQVAELSRRCPELGRIRLVVTREKEQDVMTLQAEGQSDPEKIADAVFAVTKLRGKIALGLGPLPNDGKVIVDERQIG